MGPYELVESSVGIVRTGRSTEWQVIAAGCAPEFTAVWAWDDGQFLGSGSGTGTGTGSLPQIKDRMTLILRSRV